MTLFYCIIYSFATAASQDVFHFRRTVNGNRVDQVCDIKPGNLTCLGLKFLLHKWQLVNLKGPTNFNI